MPSPDRNSLARGAVVLSAAIVVLGTGLLIWQWWTVAHVAVIPERVPPGGVSGAQVAAIRTVREHPGFSAFVTLVPPFPPSRVGNSNPFSDPNRNPPAPTAP